MIKQEDSKLERTMTSAGGVHLVVSVVGELWFPCRGYTDVSARVTVIT